MTRDDLHPGDQRAIVKMHGTIDAPSRMVFSRREYAAARYNHASFFDILDALAITHTFFFVGCSLADPDIRLLLERNAHRFRGQRPHYMVMPRTAMHTAHLDSVRANFNLKIVQYKPANHHAELAVGLSLLLEKVDAVRASMAATLDW